MTPDLLKLRRFSLALGVVLFSYVVAGFDPVRDTEGEATVNLPLVEFKIDNPDYIPIGLVVGGGREDRVERDYVPRDDSLKHALEPHHRALVHVGGRDSDIEGDYTGTGNIDDDPLFVDDF